MSAWSSELDAITTRSQRAIRDAIESWSIKTQERIDGGSPPTFRQKITNTAQVPFALFADCTHKQQRTFERYALVLNDVGNRDKRCKPTTIVRNPWRKQLILTLMDGEVSVL